MYLVKLEHLGTDQLSTRCPPICEMYRNIVTKAGHHKSGTLTGNMMFESYNSCGKHGILPFDQEFAGAFLGPFDAFLISNGAKPELESTHRDCVKLRTGEGVSCGALSTIYTSLQNPHTDMHGKELDVSY